MNVEELQALLPNAEVYTLDPNARYLVLVESSAATPSVIHQVSKSLSDMKVPHIILGVNRPSESVRILKLESTDERTTEVPAEKPTSTAD